jgi:hypothetical protein
VSESHPTPMGRTRTCHLRPMLIQLPDATGCTANHPAHLHRRCLSNAGELRRSRCADFERRRARACAPSMCSPALEERSCMRPVMAGAVNAEAAATRARSTQERCMVGELKLVRFD